MPRATQPICKSCENLHDFQVSLLEKESSLWHSAEQGQPRKSKVIQPKC